MKVHKVKKHTWILIASSVKALLYDINAYPYIQQKILTHPKSRLKDNELGTGEPGHYKTSVTGYDAYTAQHSLQEEEHQQFAKEVADYLQGENNAHHFHHLIICADPHFLGLLRQSMAKQLCDKVIEYIPKNYIAAIPENKLSDIISGVVDEIV